MPFIANTPESLIGRSDSKNPATTCRGITSGGRPCRRQLAASPGPSPAAAPRTRVNQLRADDPRDPDLYCWQHKDQANSSARSSPGPASRTKLTTVRQESFESLESLIDRLGIVEAERNHQRPPKTQKRPSDSRRNTNEKYTQQQQQPDEPEVPRPATTNSKRKPKPQPKKHARFCFCFTIPVYEEQRPARPKPRPVQSAPARPSTVKVPSGHGGGGQHLAPSSAATQHRPSLAATSKQQSSSAQSNTSQTSRYLSLIPETVLPETAANLLRELSRPFAATDEPGYIYIFWLTPESQSRPDAAVQDLLAPPTRPDVRQRRTSDVLQSFATAQQSSNQAGSGSDQKEKKTILLKIGRASNVQRRLNEWQRQCGYNVSLIRYYPYVSSSSSSSPQPRKMPHSHKVERLVHIELEGQGLRVSSKTRCDACGRNHREWFEVEATRAGINAVDEIVRRWSDWDESNTQG
ncbi:meiotically up-regulated gene 113-domain-containing protein [Xylariaceae sp. FL0594]|nr:meiotically up-regulated gene 113-domain-containing protein [Xylariaceae sp. FL0594]